MFNWFRPKVQKAHVNKFLEEKPQVQFTNLLKSEKNKNRRGHLYKPVVTPGNKTGKYFKKTPRVWTATRTKKIKPITNVVIPYTNYVAQQKSESKSKTKTKSKSKSKSRNVKTVLEL